MSRQNAQDSKASRLFGRFSPSHGTLFATTLIVAALAAAAPSYADLSSVSVNSFNPGQIEVASDGSVYTAPAIPLISLSAQLQVNLDAETSGRVKSWKAWVKVKTETGPWVQFSNDSDSESYSIPRPKTVNTVAVINVPYGSLAPYATGQCNVMADSLRGDGLSDADIFAVDRIIPISIQGALSYEMTGIAGADAPPEVEDFSSMPKFNLVCKASPQPEPEANDPTRIVPDVEQATLTIQEVTTLGGACKLNLSGVIVTNEANKEVKFRYKDAQGNQSDIKTVMTDVTKTVFFNHQYNLYGGGNKVGKIRIAIEDDNFSSPWSDYNVDCPETAAPGGVVSDDGGLPKADLIVAVDGEIMKPGLACPAKVKLIGKLEGRGTASGTIFLAAAGQPIVQTPYSIEDGEEKYVPGEYSLSWDNLNLPQQSVSFAIYVLNDDGVQVAMASKTRDFECRVVAVSGTFEGAADTLKPEDTNNPTTPTTGVGGVKTDLGKPDLMATTLGLSLAGGIHHWGSSVVLSNPALATATGMGRNRNLCRFSPAAFRPFNKGTVASGPFKTTVKRNNKQVRSTTFNLPAQSGLPGNGWYNFDLDLVQGMNVIKVELDSNETVGESDEGNNDYTLRVRVNFPCGQAGDTLTTEPTPERPKKRTPTPPTTTPPTTPSQSE